MRIYSTKNYEEMSKKASYIISSQIILKPDSVLGLATGSSPIGIYKLLVEKYKNKELDFSEIKTINLDEYKGLAPDNKQSYRYFMNNNLFLHININKNNTYLPDGLAKDDNKECKRYDDKVDELGGVDLQLLGIGTNGHIAFNEPNDFFSKGTHVTKLTESTIESNSRLFDNKEQVPHYAFTMGISQIMKAKKIILIASGKNKAVAVKESFTGNITPKVPASILQMHPDFTLIGDEEALSLI